MCASKACAITAGPIAEAVQTTGRFGGVREFWGWRDGLEAVEGSGGSGDDCRSGGGGKVWKRRDGLEAAARSGGVHHVAAVSRARRERDTIWGRGR